jgi:hypothetical protein
MRRLKGRFCLKNVCYRVTGPDIRAFAALRSGVDSAVSRIERAPGSVVSVVVASVVCLCIAGPVFGQAGQPSLDELLDLTPEGEPASQPRPDEPAARDTGEDLAESVKQALSASDAAGAFEQAVEEMQQVSRRLGRSFDPGVQTQRMQESILRKLDQVIEAAKQQQSSSGGGGGSGQPRDQDSGSDELAQQNRGGGQQDQAQAGGNQASTGAAGSGSPQDPESQDTEIKELRKEWGVLPPRLRDELSDGLRERFSPLYRRMTEAYYKALAEQE